jgi:plastocyanin
MKRTGAEARSKLRAVFCGRARAPLLVTVLVAFLCAPRAHAGTLSVVVLKKDGKPLSGAVVTAEPESAPVAPPAPLKTVVDQVDLAFVPDISIVPVGSSVSFPNSDSVSHQVYSFSPARRFQLPLYRGRPYPPVAFDQAGIVTLGCNIHDNMLAYVVVTSAPFFGRTDAKGMWSVPNVPQGSYRIRFWHPRLMDSTAMLQQTAQLAADGQPITIRLSESLRPPPLKGHPHSWDY